MARLRIGERARQTLAEIALLDQEKFSQLVDALNEATVNLYQGNLAVFVCERVSFDKDLATSIVRTVLELYAVRGRNNKTIEIFAQDVTNSLKAHSETLSKAIVENWDILTSRLIGLLNYEQTIGITVKALDVMTDHERVYCNNGTRILSDLRPIFADEKIAKPSASVIVHTLKIAYHEGNEVKEFYVTMDNRDIKQLRELLDRADEKLEALRSVIDIAQIQYLDPEVHEHSW